MIKFGTGGWRAVIGDEFIKSNIKLLAKAMCDKMKTEKADGKGIVIGYDRRFLSKEAMQWCAEVFAYEGIKSFLVNKSAPTPLIMFYVKKYDFPYGMMVTASHNPAVYNGIKVFTAGGKDADENQTADIERYAAAYEKDGKTDDIRTMEYEKAVAAGLIEEIYPLNEYIDDIINVIDMDAIKKARLRVAFDPMYGVSEVSLKTLLLTARCEVNTIHDRHDTLFGGKLPSPSADTLRSLQSCVINYNCDIGIATDGDADRIGVIDDTGRFLHPNDILVLLYYYMLEYRNIKGDVVRNIATTHVLDRIAEEYGQKCYEVPVGFKYISGKMIETGAVIGGESSGGLTVKGHINGKDGIYAAMLLVEIIAKTHRKLSDIYREIEERFGAIHMEERAYRFDAAKKEELLRILMEEHKVPDGLYEKNEAGKPLGDGIRKISYLDGSKVYFEDGGWVIARFSGTEPLLRIFCEMHDESAAKRVCEIYEQYLGL